MIRYRFISRPKRYHPGGGSARDPKENMRLRVLGGVWSQERNLKALKERYHQTWSLRLNLTQHANLTRPRCLAERQIESSFVIRQVVVHGRS